MDGRGNSWEPALLAHHQQTHLHHQRRRKSMAGRRGSERGRKNRGREEGSEGGRRAGVGRRGQREEGRTGAGRRGSERRRKSRGREEGVREREEEQGQREGRRRKEEESPTKKVGHIQPKRQSCRPSPQLTSWPESPAQLQPPRSTGGRLHKLLQVNGPVLDKKYRRFLLSASETERLGIESIGSERAPTHTWLL